MKEESDNNTTLVLFDLDGTLTRRDTFIPFLLHVKGVKSLLVSLLLNFNYFFLATISVSNRNKLKHNLIKATISGISQQNLLECAVSFTKSYSEDNYNAFSLQRLQWHLEQGHYVVLVTASLEVYADIFARDLTINRVIATKLESHDGIMTGRLLGPNCNYDEKKRRVLEEIQMDKFNDIYAYGNSSGDVAMLSLANNQYFKGKKIGY